MHGLIVNSKSCIDSLLIVTVVITLRQSLLSETGSNFISTIESFLILVFNFQHVTLNCNMLIFIIPINKCYNTFVCCCLLI
jgi:hypothetical protein